MERRIPNFFYSNVLGNRFIANYNFLFNLMCNSLDINLDWRYISSQYPLIEDIEENGTDYEIRNKVMENLPRLPRYSKRYYDAACFYISALINENPKTYEYVARRFGVDKNRLFVVVDKVKSLLGIPNFPSISARIGQIIRNLHLPHAIEESALDILHELERVKYPFNGNMDDIVIVIIYLAWKVNGYNEDLDNISLLLKKDFGRSISSKLGEILKYLKEKDK